MPFIEGGDLQGALEKAGGKFSERETRLAVGQLI